MTAYRDGIAKFDAANAKVFGISTDNAPTLAHWAKELDTKVPLLSDFMRKASADYGVLNTSNGVANRTTFVIDADGKIIHIDEGGAAIDPTGAATACSRTKK